jgi:hypothetical protein
MKITVRALMLIILALALNACARGYSPAFGACEYRIKTAECAPPDSESLPH